MKPIQQGEDARRAALNLMEDAVQAQQVAENLNRELRREIAERQHTEALLQHQKAVLEKVAGPEPLLEVLTFLAHAVESQSDEKVMVAIHLLNPSGTHFASASAPGLPAAYLQATEGLEIATRLGPCCDAVLNNEAVSVPDVARDPRYPRFAEFATECGIRAGWSTPILSTQDEVIGTFAIYYGEPHEPSARDRQMMEFMTRTVALAIERKGADETLRQSEARFRMLADNMAQLAWTCDSLGNVTWYNQRWLDYTGLSFEAMGGWGWSKVQHPDHLERVVAGVKRSAEIGEPWDDTFPLRGKDGQYRWFLSRAVPIRDHSGEIMRWFGTNTDVTEQREMQKRIKLQAEQLADESRRKDEFLAMLSHELRNPLAPIRSAVHLLRMHERSESGMQRQAREIIERQVGNLTKLISDLLEVSRVVSGRIRLDQQTMDLRQVVQHATETVKPLIEQRRHELVRNFSDVPIWVNADATRLEEVFINLLNNAAKYTEEGGRIEVRCEKDPVGAHAQVRVRDNGVGIDQELLPRIFDLFTQSERSLARSAGGLGIGLSLAQRLVDMHGGTVEAHSPPQDQPGGCGSEFIVTLPLMQAPGAPLPVEPGAEEAPQHDGVKVLVVDDNIDQVTMLASALRHAGYSVQSAHTGPDGLKMAMQWRPDLVLLDIGLPGLDGYEVARRLRSDPATKTVRLIALTGYARDTDIALSREAGFDAHLSKPLEFGELEKLMPTILPDRSNRGES